MIIRQLTDGDVFAAKALWQAVFHDTDAFANFWFSRRFTPRLSFGALDDDTLVSMALGRPYPIHKPTLNAVFCAGVSTLPAYRHQGLMTETMTRLIANAKQRGYDCILLSPAIPDLYKPFGFVPLTYAVEVTETAGDDGAVVETKSPELLLPAYEMFASRHLFCPRRDLRELERVIEECFADGGRVLLAEAGFGWLCYLPHPDGIEVTACVADAPATYKRLLAAAASRSPDQTATALLPVDCGLSGTLVRPVQALRLKPSVPIDRFARSRRCFCPETY